MKSMDIKRIGSIATGTVMLGAALAGPVGAGMDTAGLDKGFFYDANYNPVAQIVVGEKVGNALDFVAAGNIAATIGNLAYMTTTETVEGGGTAEGQVVISSSAIGATGDYVQDTAILENLVDFYDKDDGFHFDNPTAGQAVTYERGDFTQYSLACEQQTRTEAAILMEGDYSNVHCLFCQTLCLEALENPKHEMKEKITVDYDNIWYYEDGLNDDDSEDLRMAIDKDSIVYTVETGYIPMKRLTKVIGGTADDYIDFEYRGKIILLGDEYYVREVDGATKIYLSKGKVLDGISSEGYTAEYNGYKFKIDHLIYSAEYEVAGILLDVEKPDGTVVQTQISKMANGMVDDLEISGVYAEEADALASASIIAYDTGSDVLLEDGEDLEIGGTVWNDWEVTFHVVNDCVDADTDDEYDANGPDCDISEYDEIDDTTQNGLLQEIEITYKHKLDGAEALEEDESLEFPGGRFKLTFKGFRTNDFRGSSCSGMGEGDILVERGDEDYQIKVSFTGDDNNRYADVRLDEGPFRKGDAFVLDGVVYKYDKYQTIENGAGDTDDQVKVTLDPVIRGNRQKITLDRLCDPENDQGTAAGCDFTAAFCDCNSTAEEITIRALALTDAMDDKDIDRYENDEDVDVTTEDLFFKNNAINGLTMLYDGSRLVIFADSLADGYLTVNPNMIGILDDFDVDEHRVWLWAEEEGDKYLDINSTTDNTLTWDTNADGDDDDTLVLIMDDNNERVVIDLGDRDYDETVTWDFDNALGMYERDCNCTTDCQVDVCDVTEVIVLDEDRDSLLIAPVGGNSYTVDWATDNRIDSVDVCHYKDDVDATVFLGTEEEETLAEYTITKDDVGTEKTAACCTFKVEDFGVTGTAGGGAVTSAVVNPVGTLVVAESSADETKNLVIVGGPAVNAMTEAAGVTADEISAASDKYIVKKVGSKVVVAGWEADDTVAGANALIGWLKANAH